MYHERATPGCYLVDVVGFDFHANIILHEQALSLGDNGYLILKPRFQCVILHASFLRETHISPHHIFFVIICSSMDASRDLVLIASILSRAEEPL